MNRQLLGITKENFSNIQVRNIIGGNRKVQKLYEGGKFTHDITTSLIMSEGFNYAPRYLGYKKSYRIELGV